MQSDVTESGLWHTLQKKWEAIELLCSAYWFPIWNLERGLLISPPPLGDRVQPGKSHSVVNVKLLTLRPWHSAHWHVRSGDKLLRNEVSQERRGSCDCSRHTQESLRQGIPEYCVPTMHLETLQGQRPKASILPWNEVTFQNYTRKI